MNIITGGRWHQLRKLGILAIATAVTIGATACTPSRSLPESIQEAATNARMDPRAVQQCLANTQNSDVSQLEAAWDATLDQAIELAEEFDPRNTGARDSLSQVDPSTYVAFCVYSGSQWRTLTPDSDGRILLYAAQEVPLKGPITLTTNLNGLIGYF